MPDRDPLIANRLLRASRNLTIASIVLFVLIAAVAIYAVIQANDADDSATQTNNALCALRADLQDRVDRSQAFLDHPENFPSFNDPQTLALIQQQVEGQERTIKTLSDLNC